ncbi:hypothetical protein LMH73_007530 [Vibrio splendidus]|nr:hypothetical protein [Vibrio splendidus]MCC4880380.1 hypothetical protein [Vibrio splendidus]
MQHQFQYTLTKEQDVLVGIPQELAKHKSATAFYSNGEICLVINDSGTNLSFLPKELINIINKKEYFLLSGITPSGEAYLDKINVTDRYSPPAN